MSATLLVLALAFLGCVWYLNRLVRKRRKRLSSLTWCRCGDGIEDPKCETCELTDREPREDMGDSQMRAMIDQACEDLGRHGLQSTDEAAQVVLNLIVSASELGRLVDLRNEPSAVEGWTLSDIDALTMAGRHLGTCDHPGCLRCRASRNVVGIAYKRILAQEGDDGDSTHSTEDRE